MSFIEQIKRPVWVLVFVVLAAVGYYLFWYTSPGERFAESVRQARELCLEGKCEESVKELERLLPSASSPREEGIAKTDLALSYLDTDVVKGIQLLKEIAADTSYADWRRAYAVEKMAEVFMLSGRYRLGSIPPLVFSGDPYASFLAGDPRENMPEAMRRLYEYATEFWPRPISEYRIAEWYAQQAYYAKFDPQRLTTKVPLDEYIAIASDHLQKGDARLTETHARFGELNNGYASWLRGYVMGLLADVTGDGKYDEEAKSSFNHSLQVLKQYNGPSENYKKSQLLWMSFYYASFLAKRPDYDQAIMGELMEYLVDPDARATRPPKTAGESDLKFGLMQYLERLGKITTTRPRGIDYQRARALADKEPKFAELLKNLGWDL